MLRTLLALLLVFPVAATAVSGNAGEGPYLALDPFVVNIQDGSRLRFMQVKVQLMSGNSQIHQAIKMHMPAVRDALVMLLSHQNVEGLGSLEGREALRAQALTAAQSVVTQFTGVAPTAGAAIEAVYFTDFVIQ